MNPIFLGIVAILTASAIGSSNNSYVKLSPTKTAVVENEVFSIAVYANAHVPVNALDMTIKFDPKQVMVTAVDKGQSVLTIWAQEPLISNGEVRFGGGTYKRGFVGEHLIVTLNVKALQAGSTDFFIDSAQLLAGDGKGTPVKLESSTSNTKKSFIIYNQNDDPSKISANVAMIISADLDGDGLVTLKDISAFLGAWYEGDSKYDFNNDYKMNFVDFSIILARSFMKSNE